MATTTRQRRPEGLLGESAKAPSKPSLWERIATAGRGRTCLYCGRKSSEKDIAVFSASILDSSQPVADVCPHCVKVDAFTQKSGWEIKGYGSN